MKDLGQPEDKYYKCRLCPIKLNMTNIRLVDTINQSSTAGTPAAHHSQPLGNAGVTPCQGLRWPPIPELIVEPGYLMLLLVKKSWKFFTAASPSLSGTGKSATSPPPCRWKTRKDHFHSGSMVRIGSMLQDLERLRLRGNLTDASMMDP